MFIARRGLSLPEVLVATGILFMLFVATLSIFIQARAAQQKSDVHNDAFRTVALAHEKVHELLRGFRVLQPAYDPTTPAVESVLVLELPQLSPQGQPLVDTSGAVLRDPVPSEIRVMDGRLLRHRGDTDWVLVRLGQNGRVEFERPANDLLKVKIRAQADDSIYESSSEHYLANPP